MNVFRTGRCRARRPFRKVTLVGEAARYGCEGKLSGGSARCSSAFVMNAFQISAGYVPPATGLPWYSVCIGRSSFG